MSERDEKIEAWLVSHYLETEREATVKEIAAATGFTESVVRRSVTSNPSLASGYEYRVSYSRDYKYMETGGHKVMTYGPSRRLLAYLLAQSRKAVTQEAQEG